MLGFVSFMVGTAGAQVRATLVAQGLDLPVAFAQDPRRAACN
jgi:uncharacterized membrane protein